MSSSGVIVRRVLPEGWEALRQVRLAAMLDSPDAFASTYERELSFDEAAWQARVERSPWWLAVAADRAIGLIAAFTAEPDLDPGDRHVVSMWVEPAWRGEGIGDLLMDSLVAWALGDGARSLSLWVVTDNARARKFYERLGFVTTGQEAPVPSKPTLTEVLMRRPLAEA
jgi:GNAT superfamily N-acetyltransferase